MDIAILVATLVFAIAAFLVGIILLIRSPSLRALPPALTERLAAIESLLNQSSLAMREDGRAARDEWRSLAHAQTQALEQRFNSFEIRLDGFSRTQSEQLEAMRQEARDGRKSLDESLLRALQTFGDVLRDRLRETSEAMVALEQRLTEGQRESRADIARQMSGVVEKIEALIVQNAAQQEALRETVATALDKVREDNAQKLEKMRETVEEKLQGTLEKRLGESFQMVSDRLEQVHKGLGEMQTLASGVGDLKRIMTNVKSRGGWGEVQLGMLLDDMLTPDQFASNVRIRPDSGEVVEFAVRLPGKGDGDQPLWLPIDAKLPQEDYERLLRAQEAGLAEDSEKAAQTLEKAIRLQAKTICDKYIHPPHSTDFAILYLPTEGLFAEVIRRPGLVSELQNKHRIMVQGPTTLAALLTSLQMGFRTLAIEKRSSEVWQILAAAKDEFKKYGDVWEKLGKQLDTARRTVDEAGKRTRAVSRRLRDVDMLNAPETPPLLDAFVTDELEDEPLTES